MVNRKSYGERIQMSMEGSSISYFLFPNFPFTGFLRD
jgi:hypothetical protein